MTHLLLRALAALSFLALPGCLDPQVHGLTPAPRAAGLWTECSEAAAHGLSGDPCTFSGLCGDYLTAEVPTTAAFCRRDGWLVVNTQEVAAGEALDQPRVLADGCIEHTLVFGNNARLCASDAMVGFSPREAPLDFDAEGACAALVDATPGFPCRGTGICAFGHVDDLRISVDTEPPLLRPGVLGWCHWGRIRTATTTLVLPCEPTGDGPFVTCAY